MDSVEPYSNILQNVQVIYGDKTERPDVERSFSLTHNEENGIRVTHPLIFLKMYMTGLIKVLMGLES